MPQNDKNKVNELVNIMEAYQVYKITLLSTMLSDLYRFVGVLCNNGKTMVKSVKNLSGWKLKYVLYYLWQVKVLLCPVHYCLVLFLLFFLRIETTTSTQSPTVLREGNNFPERYHFFLQSSYSFYEINFPDVSMTFLETNKDFSWPSWHLPNILTSTA